jgi:hypothetical protein
VHFFFLWLSSVDRELKGEEGAKLVPKQGLKDSKFLLVIIIPAQENMSALFA